MFVGKDVAKALGYSNPRKALLDHVDEEDKGVTKRDTLGGTQKMTIINDRRDSRRCLRNPSRRHQRVGSLLSDSFFEAATGPRVQTMGDRRGAAANPQDGRLYSHQGQRGRTAHTHLFGVDGART